MARRRIDMFDLQNLLHYWQQGRSWVFIQESLGIDRKTARKYVSKAQAAGITREASLGPEVLAPLMELLEKEKRAAAPAAVAQDQLLPWRQQIGELLGVLVPEDGLASAEPLTMKTIRQRLRREHNVQVSYSAFKRFVRREFPDAKRRVTIAMPTPDAGAFAQVDFGYVGLMLDPIDGRMRRTWAFVMTLCHSRHMFVRFVNSQSQAEWVRCHVEAFEFFGGVPECVALDNLKAGVIKADLYDPKLNAAYAECARHYGFVIDTCRVRKPTDKGKVERQVPYVRDALVGGYSLKQLGVANETARAWCLGEAGLRDHGTTGRKPYEVFIEDEKSALKNLPTERFEVPSFAQPKVHPDHHLVFERGFYSVPTRFVGQTMFVRGTLTQVQIFSPTGELVRTWTRATDRERRRTNWNDYPPGKRAFLVQHPRYCRDRARELGDAVLAFVERLLESHSYAHLRKVQAILRLADKYGARRLNSACARALAFEDLEYRTVKNILASALELTSDSERGDETAPERPVYVRSGDSFVHGSLDAGSAKEGEAA